MTGSQDVNIPAPEKQAKMDAVARKAVRTMAGWRPKAMSTSGPTTKPLQKAAPASSPYLHWSHYPRQPWYHDLHNS